MNPRTIPKEEAKKVSGHIKSTGNMRVIQATREIVGMMKYKAE